MDFLFQLLTLSGLFALVLIYGHWRASVHSPKNKGKSPPQPSGGWPVIGHLLLLSGLKAQNATVARSLGALADRYGPIFTIRLGVYPTLVVSSWEGVKECFTINDKAFADRPISYGAKVLSYNYAAFGFAPYGPYWREMRKLALVELLSARRLDLLRHIRVSEVENSIKRLYSGHGRPVKVVISRWFEKLTLSIIVRMIAGKSFLDGGGREDEEAERFTRVIKEFMYMVGRFNLSDIIPIPFLRWMDLKGNNKAMMRVSAELSSILENWIQDRRRQRRLGIEPGDEKDFIDVMLSVISDDFATYGHTRETIIKATMMNLISAGSDTTSVNLTWILSLLLNNPYAMSCAQKEIETKIGRERWVEESDIKNLVYLQAIIKESMRLYPPGPLSVPHQAREDCEVGGYHIRKGTRLFVNVWKLHRDPRVWSEPEEFMPERFLNSHKETDFSGQWFEYTPFGSGRRSCPGIAFAMQVTHLTLARLLQGFDFTTLGDAPVDMTEGLGITLPKAIPLEVFITPRLATKLYEQ